MCSQGLSLHCSSLLCNLLSSIPVSPPAASHSLQCQGRTLVIEAFTSACFFFSGSLLSLIRASESLASLVPLLSCSLHSVSLITAP